MYVILNFDEEDSQSSRECWNVWYPYRREGFETRDLAEAQILKEGHAGAKYFICEVSVPVTPVKTLALAVAS